MNGKRQTIWLVSMLSLMVVLSAYYLFTEDSGASVPKETAGTIQVDSAKNTADAADPTVGDSGVVVNEVVTQGEVAADPGTAADNSNAATANSDSSAILDDSTAGTTNSADPENTATDTTATNATDEKSTSDQTATNTADSGKVATDPAVTDKAATDTASTSKTKIPAKDDAAILDEVASQSVSASSLFSNYLYEREQKNLKDQNDLLALINDMDKTPADNAVAQEQLRTLEEKESKITGIEEQLQQKYGEAIVKEESGDSYKVVVLSDKLDVKSAVVIVDLVMKELSVSQDKVSVQYVTEQ